MVHKMKVFMLYVGIIAAIQEHTSDHYHERVLRHVYIYPNPFDHMLKSFTSIKYKYDIKYREGYSDSRSQSGSTISQLVLVDEGTAGSMDWIR
jgi:hypothetical protein